MISASCSSNGLGVNSWFVVDGAGVEAAISNGVVMLWPGVKDRICLVMGCPLAMIMARWMMFSSSRTLPFHGSVVR